MPTLLRATRAARALGALGTTPRRKAAVVLTVLAVTVVGLYFKSAIALQLRGGETIRVELAENVNLIAGETRVKMAGLQVGVVSAVEEAPDGATLVELDVDHQAVAKLGATPSARIQPLTILGGAYAVELVPGGSGEYDGRTIPQSRTRTPVELDQVLAALPSPTRSALQRTTRRLGGTLNGRTAAELRKLTRSSARVMVPGGRLWVAARGTNPATDLRSTADALVGQQDHLDGALRGLHTTTRVLATEADHLAATVDALPAALASADAASDDLTVTLGKLDAAATELLPTARKLDPLTRQLIPLLRDAAPVARQLPRLLRATRPLVRDLVPAASYATGVVRDIDGPVIDRLNGPILSTLGSTYRGTGPFKDTGGGVQADNKFYEEIGYMVLNIDRASQEHDPQGSLLNFQAGVSVGTLAPLQLDEALAALVPEVLGR